MKDDPTRDLGGIKLRIDCTEPGCSRCVAQIVGGVLRFRAKHDGVTHSVELPLDELCRIMEATAARVLEMPPEVMGLSRG